MGNSESSHDEKNVEDKNNVNNDENNRNDEIKDEIISGIEEVKKLQLPNDKFTEKELELFGRMFEAARESPVSQETMNTICNLICQAKSVGIFSGAGISAESGISTFRAPKVGIWANKIGLGLFGTPLGWNIMPGTAWKVYMTYFRHEIARAKPNLGHYAIAILPSLLDDQTKFEVITQNVDGLHQKAGSKSVQELHGTIFRHLCSKAKHLQSYQLDVTSVGDGYIAEEDRYFYNEDGSIAYPRCDHPNCSSYLRPDAVLFTEPLPELPMTTSINFIHKMKKNDVMIVVGTSGLVYPAASLPPRAKRCGATLVEVNPEPSSLTEEVDFYVSGKSGIVLSHLITSILTLKYSNNNNNNHPDENNNNIHIDEE